MTKPVEINPQRLFGNWTEGWSLDFHVLKSEFLGYDEFCGKIFDTVRTDIGDLLYFLKYKGVKENVKPIAETASKFLIESGISKKLDAVVPVPPSRYRSYQPVVRISHKISEILGLEFIEDCVIKTKDIDEIKNIPDRRERIRSLQDAFNVDVNLEGKIVLLFDDIFQSGATLTAITDKILELGMAKNVYVLTVTQTRT